MATDRYAQCDDTCTADCGACKGAGRPAPFEAGDVVEAVARELANHQGLRGPMDESRPDVWQNRCDCGWDDGDERPGWRERYRLHVAAAAIAAVPPSPAETCTAEQCDRACEDVIAERDRMEDIADQLACAIAPVEVIGEHSSANNPWQNALDILRERPAPSPAEEAVKHPSEHAGLTYLTRLAARPSADTETLRRVLLNHHPLVRSETGPLSGCRCGQVKLGQDVIAHVAAQLVAALPPSPAEEAGKALVAVSQWINAGNAHRDSESVLWSRVLKVTEEAGEVFTALSGAIGENPRKGVTHTMDDVVDELLDTASAALAAVEHVRGHDGQALPLLADKIRRVHARAALASPAPAPQGEEGQR